MQLKITEQMGMMNWQYRVDAVDVWLQAWHRL